MKIVKLICPNCGAPITKKTTKCEYCGSSFILEDNTVKVIDKSKTSQIDPDTLLIKKFESAITHSTAPAHIVTSNNKGPEKPISKRATIIAVILLVSLLITGIAVGCTQAIPNTDISHISNNSATTLSDNFIADLDEAISTLKVHNNDPEYQLQNCSETCSFCNSTNVSVYGINSSGYNTLLEEDIFTLAIVCNDCLKETFKLKKRGCTYLHGGQDDCFKEYPELFPEHCQSCGHRYSYVVVENRILPDLSIQMTEDVYYGKFLTQIYFLVCEDCNYTTYVLQEQLEEIYKQKHPNEYMD